MQIRMMACLVLLGILSAASTQAQDSMKQCNVSTGACVGTETFVWTEMIEVDDEILVFVDYDIHTGGINFCDAIFYATYNSEKLQFLAGEAVKNPGSESVACQNWPDPPSNYCTDCDTVVGCYWYSNGASQRPEVVPSAEMAMRFKALTGNVQATVYADQWFSWEHSSPTATDCAIELTEGALLYTFPDVGIPILPVPEPGKGLMLMAGIPFLAWIGRKKGSRQVSDGQLEAVAQASRSLPPVAHEQERLAQMKIKLDQAIG